MASSMEPPLLPLLAVATPAETSADGQRRRSVASPPRSSTPQQRFSPPASPPNMRTGVAVDHVQAIVPRAMDAASNASSNTSNSSGFSHRLLLMFFVIVGSCAAGLMSVATLIQRQSPTAFHVLVETAATPEPVIDNVELWRAPAPAKDVPAPAKDGGSDHDPDATEFEAEPAASMQPHQESLLILDPAPDSFGVKLPVADKWRLLGNLSEYECVAWRQTGECSPLGPREPVLDETCDAAIYTGLSGYCELRHRPTGRIQRVMELFCDSLRPNVEFRCNEFVKILDYGRHALTYTHDRAFTPATTRKMLLEDQTDVTKALAKQAATQGPIGRNAMVAAAPTQFTRGIALVVYDKVLESVYASIRSLRALNCTLPIELWYAKSETNVTHPVLEALLDSDRNVYMREIRDDRASWFYTKIYAVFYSAFDQVLLLDADNYAVRDPEYLFDTREFTDTGAMFWPDFWRPKKTIFNIQPRSLVWDVFDLDAVDMFEQESGQVMVDRTRHQRALNAIMYYVTHPDMIESLRLVWGDKDLFRFAWMKTQSKFHMIQMPPGAAGAKLPDQEIFCGVTMVQHDPSKEIVFMHRNQEKLSRDNHRAVWKHIQQFKKSGVSLEEYDVRGANGGRYYPEFKRCYGKDIYYEDAFTVKPMDDFPFAGLEQQLLGFLTEAEALMPATEAPPEAVED